MKKIGPKTRKYMVTVGMATGLLLSCMVSGASGYVLISVFRPLEGTNVLRKFHPWRIKELYQGRLKVLTERHYKTHPAVADAVSRLNQVRNTGLKWEAIPSYAKWFREHKDAANKDSWMEYGNVEILPDSFSGIGLDGMDAAAGFYGKSFKSWVVIPTNPANAVVYISADPTVNFNWGTGAPAPDQTDLVGTMLHELLHVSGQNHVPETQCTNPNNQPVMCPFLIRGSTNDRYLKFSDRQGLRALYPLGLRNRSR